VGQVPFVRYPSTLGCAHPHLAHESRDLRIFITGSTGYVGSAVVRALVHAGHEVTGLVRTSSKAALLEALGGTPLVGDLTEPQTYRSAASEHDVLIHAGMETGPEKIRTDRVAVETLLSAARASGEPRGVIYTSVLFLLGNTGGAPVDENAPTDPSIEHAAGRPAHERLVLEAADERLATAVIRPGMIYGGADGAVSQLFLTAEENGAATYVGEGANRWPLIYREDVAELYRRVAERRARGIFHAVDGTAPRVAGIAQAASRAAGRGGASRSLPLHDARGFLGAFADALCLDQVVATPRAHALGWTPVHPPFLDSAPAVYQEWKRTRHEPRPTPAA
jgi:nucleoside-diphosphate-sugar epimerase